jgi:hypothetical protein
MPHCQVLATHQQACEQGRGEHRRQGAGCGHHHGQGHLACVGGGEPAALSGASCAGGAHSSGASGPGKADDPAAAPPGPVREAGWRWRCSWRQRLPPPPPPPLGEAKEARHAGAGRVRPPLARLGPLPCPWGAPAPCPRAPSGPTPGDVGDYVGRGASRHAGHQRHAHGQAGGEAPEAGDGPADGGQHRVLERHACGRALLGLLPRSPGSCVAWVHGVGEGAAARWARRL